MAKPRDDAHLASLLPRAKAGDKDAVAELFHVYSNDFLRAVRSVLSPRLRTIYDSTDFLQETMLELLKKNLVEQCSSIDSFRALIMEVARRKVMQANRKHLDGQCRNLNREVHVSHLGKHEPREQDLGPDGACEVLDEWSAVIGRMPRLYQVIYTLLSRAYSPKEISAIMDIPEGTVRRFTIKIADGLTANGNWPY